MVRLSYDADFSVFPREGFGPWGLDTKQLKLEAIWRLSSAFKPSPTCVCEAVLLSPFPLASSPLIFHKYCHGVFMYEKKMRQKK